MTLGRAWASSAGRVCVCACVCSMVPEWHLALPCWPVHSLSLGDGPMQRVRAGAQIHPTFLSVGGDCG